MDDIKKLKELKAKNKKREIITKAIIMGIITIGSAVYVIESAITNWVFNTPFHFQITSGISLFASTTILTIISYIIEANYLVKINVLQNSLFGSVNDENKEKANTLIVNWRKNYASISKLFQDINIARSVVTMLLARQISSKLKELANGLRLEETEYQEFYNSTQKKLGFILKSKNNNGEMSILYQQSCSLLKENGYNLE